jgi:hypothetical protein
MHEKVPKDLLDDPKKDYSGYYIENSGSIYALRNLPPTNDPKELEGRKAQQVVEVRLQKAPTSRIFGAYSMSYYRRLGHEEIMWDKYIEENGLKKFQVRRTIELLIGFMFLVFLMYCCSNDIALDP